MCAQRIMPLPRAPRDLGLEVRKCSRNVSAVFILGKVVRGMTYYPRSMPPALQSPARSVDGHPGGKIFLNDRG